MADINIRIPKRNLKVLRRARLLDLLHNNIHRKLSFICAPAGYGKTTLLVDFAEDVDAEIFWYRILEQDTSLAAFYESLVQAFQVKIPSFGSNQEGLSQTGDHTPRSLAISLAAIIEESIDLYSIMVIDDYHIISDDPEINDFMDTFLEFLPDQLRILIGSRSVYGIPTAALYIQEQLSVISSSELAFIPNELIDLCRQYYQIDLHPDHAQRIIEESEGWIIAILLALRTENTTIEIPKILGAREHIYQYLANEVVSSLSDELKDFMLATSIADQFTSKFANYLLEVDNSESMIRELEELNLFLSDSDNKADASYRYHQLFSEFLQSFLGKNSPEKVKLYNQRAADWFKENDSPENAISHYFKAGLQDLAAEVINNSSRQFHLNGQIKLLESWYQQLLHPNDLRHLAPVLLLDLGKTKITNRQPALCEELLNLAEPLIKDLKDYNNLANLYYAKGILYRSFGDYKKILSIADDVQDLTIKHELTKHYWFQAERLKGIASFYLGEVDNAFTFLENAAKGFREEMNLTENHDQIFDLIMTLADVGYFGVETGRIFEAQSSYREALELSKKIRKNYTNTTMVKNNYAYLHFLLGNFKEAWRLYAQAIEIAETFQINNYLVHVYNGQADILRDISEYEEAEKIYLEALKLAESISYPLGQAQIFSGLMQLNFLSENFNEALFYIRETARVNKEGLDLPVHQENFGKVYLAMGQYDLAKSCFEKVIIGLGEDPQPDQILVETYFHYANLSFLLGEKETALNQLKIAFQNSAALGFDEFLVPLARKPKDFLEELSKEWDSPQLKSLIKRSKKKPLTKDQLFKPPEKTTKVVSSLQVLAFGKGAVRLDGKLIENQLWHSAGARAMFHYLIDRKRVTKEEIALDFWPDFSPGKINSNFHAVLWRVRNALGGKHMIEFKEEHYQLNPHIKLFSDLHQFQQLVDQVGETQNKTKERILLRQALELYQGDYLTDIDMPWADQRRTKIRNQFLGILEKLARIEFEKKNYSESLILYDQLIEIDPYQDHYHLNLMKCMVAELKIKDAKKHYIDYSNHIQVELGLSPSLELDTYYKNI
ncbi:MAG: tetratricopeptide repeat protein [Chloroflexi bacterium]|jgi:LuxR family transcriptional regulator, maltose regulon positive regulatory protein|nr:tetratricopeptide repeat protein [Chloroflexota bacterium]MBT3669798.1 tetratricopeptide repeat protein [Chloroflexota bacterium]MBT4003885.1 tetratricopeptide repeat protein [Chloroflexota bacterium]MBT4304699.1 tetratricopeptide repeat protein [Chloroflexota bacterium]MBT4534799.1 tetratricopeptide repeat protein [Chloroflexota bacterium]